MNDFNTTRDGVEIKIVETGQIFNSIKACADYLGVSPSAVSRVVSGDSITCRGCHIVPANGTAPIYYVPETENRGRPGTRVRVVETKKEYDSILDCAKDIRGSAGTIHDILHNKRSRTTHKGLHFEMVD